MNTKPIYTDPNGQRAYILEDGIPRKPQPGDWYINAVGVIRQRATAGRGLYYTIVSAPDLDCAGAGLCTDYIPVRLLPEEENPDA